MTRKSFLVLLGVTLAMVIAAAVARTMQPDYTRVSGLDEPVFPELSERINDVARIEIGGADGAFTLVRDGEAWSVAERGDYPAEAEKVRKAVFALAELRLAEARTRLPERYERIHVRDVDTEGARGMRVRLTDGGGEVLADAIIGQTALASSGLVDGGVYLRKPDEEQAWLAAGKVEFENRIKYWIDPAVVDIKSDRVRRVTVNHPDGETVVVSKADPADGEFRLHGIPDGREVKSTFARDSIPAFVDGLEMDDIRPADDPDLDWSETTEAVFETFDGLTLRVTLTRAGADGEGWMRLHAGAAEPDETEAGAEDDPEPAVEAETINGRVGGWAYKVPGWKAGDLRQRMADLTQPKGAGGAGS